MVKEPEPTHRCYKCGPLWMEGSKIESCPICRGDIKTFAVDKILEKAKAETRAAFIDGDFKATDLVQRITIDCCRDLALLKDSEDPKALLDAILEIIIF